MARLRARLRGRLLLALAVALATTEPASAERVTILAAASLTDAVTAIAESARADGHDWQLSFAASSTLARQIEAGAPADVFASASPLWMDHLETRGLIQATTRVAPIGNRLALIAAMGGRQLASAITPALSLADLLGPDGRLAIGDPVHVPAGIYAKAALTHLGQWTALEPRLARADNVRAALALVARGETPLGIAYATDAAIDAEVAVLGLFPADSHPPIRYPFALVAGAGAGAAVALIALTNASAQAIYARFGFETAAAAPP